MMRLTLWISTSRSAPAISTPNENDVPDRHQDAEEQERDEDRKQREVVRNFRRQMFFQTSGRNFMTWSLRQHAFLEMERAPGALGRVRVVRHHDDGLAVVAVERLQQVENLVAGLAIEIARGLVAQQQRRIGDDGARDADALLLAAGELTRIVLGAIGQPDDFQRDARPLSPLRLRQLRQQQRQLDVPLGRQHGQEVVELEDEADVLRAPLRELTAAQRAHWHAVHFDRASRRRIEAADQIEQRRFARPRRAHEREEIAFRDFEVDAFEHVDALAAAREVLVDVSDANEFICQCHCYRFVGSVRL